MFINWIKTKPGTRRTFLRGARGQRRPAASRRDGTLPARMGRSGRDAETKTARLRVPSRWCTAPPAATTGVATQHILGAGQDVGARLRPVAERLSSLEPYRDRHDDRQQHRRASMAEAFEPEEIGGDHFRSSAVFLTQSPPASDRGLGRIRVGNVDGPALREALRAGDADTVDAAVHRERRPGGWLRYGYACVYTDTVSWSSRPSRCR